jgi:hypothetical protein
MTSLFAATSAALTFDTRMRLSRFALADREPLRCMDTPATQPPGLSPVADAFPSAIRQNGAVRQSG